MDRDQAAPPAPSPARGPAARGDAAVRAWCRYSWSVHAWLTAISAVLIGPWMLALATSVVGDRGVLFGVGPWDLRADAFPSAMVAVAAVLQLLVLPLGGALVDGGRSPRRWLAGASATGSVVCLLLALTGGGAWLAAGLLFLAGAVAVGLSDLLANGMLPRIAEPERRDAVSARAQAIGYAGGGLLLGIDLALLQVHGSIGLSKAAAVRICFVTAGLWWAGFGLPACRRLPGRRRGVPADAAKRRRPFTELRDGLRLLRGMPQARRYLLAYLFFADAMSGVISLSSTYLTHELFHSDADKAAPFLFELILMIQFVAALGSVAAGRIARRVGAKPVVVVGLLVWCAVVVYAWASLHSTVQAVVMGVAVGVGMGAVTALARSLFAQMVPPGRESTFFGLYEVCNQGTAWMAPLVFTLVVNATGSFRQAILALIALFLLGLAFLLATDTERAAAEARALPAA